MKKILPHTNMYLEKKGLILIAFSDNHGYSLILYQNSTSYNFLNASWNVEFETTTLNFSYYAVLESIGLSWALRGFLNA